MSSALCGDVSLQLQLDRTSVSLEDAVNVKVVLRGAQDNDEYPQLQVTPKVRVKDGGTASQMSIINGSISYSKSFTFTVFPEKSGPLQIGPATITVNGKTYSSNSATVQVIPADKQDLSDRVAFIRSTVSNKTPYVNEQVIYTFKFYSRGNARVTSFRLPGFEGFWIEDMGDEKNYSEMANGINWNVVEIKKAIFPTKARDYKIPDLTLNAEILSRDNRRSGGIFDDFFGGRISTREVNLTAPSIEVKARPLPDNNGHTTSTLVGQFSIHAELSKNVVSVGDSITLTVVVKGTGNVRDVELPEFEIQGVKIYKDKPAFDLGLGGIGVVGTKTFKMALVPQVTGELVIQPIKISFYDLEHSVWKSVSTDEIKVGVKPGESKDNVNLVGAAPTPGIEQHNIKILGQDLMGIKRNVYPYKLMALSSVEVVVGLLLIVLMPMLYMTLYFLRKRAQVLTSNITLVKNQMAFKEFKGRYKKLGGGRDDVQNASLALRVFIGDKIGIDGASLTAFDIPQKLSSRVSSEMIQKIVSFLKVCDQATYGGGAVNFDKKMAMDLAKTLDRELQ